jgi:hypothetical protein
VVFLIRKSIETDFREIVFNRLLRRPFEIKLAFQEFDELPKDFRSRPSAKSRSAPATRSMWR